MQVYANIFEGLFVKKDRALAKKTKDANEYIFLFNKTGSVILPANPKFLPQKVNQSQKY